MHRKGNCWPLPVHLGSRESAQASGKCAALSNRARECGDSAPQVVRAQSPLEGLQAERWGGMARAGAWWTGQLGRAGWAQGSSGETHRSLLFAHLPTCLSWWCQTRAWLCLSGSEKAEPWVRGWAPPALPSPCAAGVSAGSSSEAQGLQGVRGSCGGQGKGLGAWGAVSLRPAEPGGSVLRPPTPLLSPAQSERQREGAECSHVSGQEAQHPACRDQRHPPPVGTSSAQVPQIQGLPQGGVSKPLLPDDSAHDARRAPWERPCRPVSSRPLCPSPALSTRWEATFPLHTQETEAPRQHPPQPLRR